MDAVIVPPHKLGKGRTVPLGRGRCKHLVGRIHAHHVILDAGQGAILGLGLAKKGRPDRDPGRGRDRGA